MLTVRCDHCGKTNRIPVAAEGTPRCGNCHRPLPWIVDADEQDFTEVAERATLPVLVDLWAAWCGPCRMVSPALERVAREMAGRIKLVKVDVDKSQRLQQRFTVMAVPTLLILDRGREIARQAGAAPPHVLREWAEKAIARRAQPA
ncbi:thioredoxin [Streptomyces sp. RB6PN25]|uniref:Thioredoxin n=2 Tax=Streptomyces humicola TaxID=2953240 RepID=A0ABT1PNS0_9ACTN|nr:thioredoxin [Streptomyces humicola]MCQ4079322.1 thioredoxin [Streptomyces humicola]